MVRHRPTLVLNKHWVPIDVTNVMRALCKLADGNARAVNLEDFSTHDLDSWTRVGFREAVALVRGGSYDVPAPDVIILTRYDRVPVRKPAFSRANVIKRDRGACQYCGLRDHAARLTIDHVLPRSRGGATVWSNCVAACVACNRRKNDRTPEEARMRLAKPPAQPVWMPPRPWEDEARWARFVQGH
ncbi:MAG: HNH endonuclease [Planctomycetes bacterium]|nr:HNH endonuclease [Planctomycetota bacterium]